jgi:transcriptional regulator with XRE-family HTH domain
LLRQPRLRKHLDSQRGIFYNVNYLGKLRETEHWQSLRRRRKMREKNPTTLGQRIKQVRGEMTQGEFADLIRIKQAMISRYEAEKETPSPRILLRIAQVHGTSIAWLLTGMDTVKSSNVKSTKAASKTFAGRDDLINLASGCLKDAKLPDAEDFSEMMKDLFKDRKTMARVLQYYRYISSSGRED